MIYFFIYVFNECLWVYMMRFGVVLYFRDLVMNKIYDFCFYGNFILIGKIKKSLLSKKNDVRL